MERVKCTYALCSECNVIWLLCFCHRSSREEEEVDHAIKQMRSASCPSPSLQGLRLPQSLSQHPSPLLSPSSTSSSLSSSPFLSSVSTAAVGWALPTHPNLGETGEKQESARRGSILSRLMKRVSVEKGGAEKEAELHFYAVSPTSRIYLHLLSSWNSYIKWQLLITQLLIS